MTYKLNFLLHFVVLTNCSLIIYRVGFGIHKTILHVAYMHIDVTDVCEKN